MRAIPVWQRRGLTIALFAGAFAALLAGATLTGIAALANGAGPEPCCGAKPAAAPTARPSPTSPAPTARPTGPPTCLVGSWLSVQETLTIQFYTGDPRGPFTSSGRNYEFRVDGSAIERYDNVSMVGQTRGREARIVVTGSRDVTWTATDKQLTVGGAKAESLTYTFYDGGRQVGTESGSANPGGTELYDYTCLPGGRLQLTGGPDQINATLARTTAVGVYG